MAEGSLVPSYITELRPCDVLLGRGSGSNDHEGNIRFRQIVSKRKDEYMATNHRMTKVRIAQEIVDQVLANNGRFLRRLEGQDAKDHGVPEGTEAWVLVDEDTIMEKAKQALRQNAQKRDNEKTPPMDFGDLEPTPLPPSAPQSFVNMPHFADNLAVHPTQQVKPIQVAMPDTRWPHSGGEMPWPVEELSMAWSQNNPNNNNNITSTMLQPPQSTSWAPNNSLYQQEMDQQTAHSHFPMTSIQIQQQQHIDPDSMLAMLPPTKVTSTYLSLPNTNDDNIPDMVTSNNSNNYNYNNSNLQQPQPHEAIGRRNSMTMGELVRAHVSRRRYSNMSTDDYSEVMDSVSKMSVTDNERRKMHASTETIETIEGMLGDVGSVADMSFATVDSAAFSASKPNEYGSTSTTSTSGDTLSSGGKKQLSLPERNTYTAMSGNLGILSSPPSLIRPEDGARRRGRRTSIDMAANENHDILETAEYVYHEAPPHDEQEEVGNHEQTADGRLTRIVDMPKSTKDVTSRTPVDQFDDMSSLSFRPADLDMTSTSFEIPPDGKDW